MKVRLPKIDSDDTYGIVRLLGTQPNWGSIDMFQLKAKWWPTFLCCWWLPVRHFMSSWQCFVTSVETDIIGKINCKPCIHLHWYFFSNPTVHDITSHMVVQPIGGSKWGPGAMAPPPKAQTKMAQFAAFCIIKKKNYPGGMPPDPPILLICSVFLALVAAGPLQCECLEPPVDAT